RRRRHTISKRDWSSDVCSSDLERRTGQQLRDLSAEHEGKLVSFQDAKAAPVPVITSPEWSGSETGGRRYSPFTINVERLKPWHKIGRASCRERVHITAREMAYR